MYDTMHWGDTPIGKAIVVVLAVVVIGLFVIGAIRGEW